MKVEAILAMDEEDIATANAMGAGKILADVTSQITEAPADGITALAYGLLLVGVENAVSYSEGVKLMERTAVLLTDTFGDMWAERAKRGALKDHQLDDRPAANMPPPPGS